MLCRHYYEQELTKFSSTRLKRDAAISGGDFQTLGYGVMKAPIEDDGAKGSGL